MFLLIGLGPRPPGTIQLSALEALKRADEIYLELYTNLGYTAAELSAAIGKPVHAAPRTLVESERLLSEAKSKVVALCVIGDIFTATTHSVLYLDCLQAGIPCELYPNAGVMNAVGMLGLELYKYGETISIPYPKPSYTPASYVAKLLQNRERGLHTLCLLDIKADEDKYMTIPEALALLALHGVDIPLAIGVARLAAPDMAVKAGTPGELATHPWGAQPHSLVILGALNAVEEEFVERWRA